MTSEKLMSLAYQAEMSVRMVLDVLNNPRHAARMSQMSEPEMAAYLSAIALSDALTTARQQRAAAGHNIIA